MRTKGIVRGGVVVAVSTLISLGGVVSATGAEKPLPQRSPEAAHRAVVAAMQRDLDLTAEQAEQQLVRQTKAASIDRSLRSKLGTGYGGSWLDRKSGKLVVGVTKSALSSQVRSAGAGVKMVGRSQSDLNRIKSELDAAAKDTRTTLSAAASWAVDPVTNQVVVSVVKGESTAKVKNLVAEHGDAVRIEEVPVRPTTQSEWFDAGDPYNITVSSTSWGECSVGFNVTKDGANYFLSAGHCGTAGQKLWYGSQQLGTVVESWFPTYDDSLNSNTNPGYWVPGPWIAAYNGNPNDAYPVNGYLDSPVGTAVCKVGRTTGLTCGWIKAKDVTVNYPDHGTVYHLTQDTSCSQRGDSGGGNFSSNSNGTFAEGMTSGGASIGGLCLEKADPPQENIHFYQPIAASIDFYGVTLETQ